jgi:hypothetical protein
MGGTGGMFNSYYTPERYKEMIRESREKTQDIEFETTVNEGINKLLADYNNRNVDAISAHLEDVKRALEEDIEGSLKLMFGGSVSKHTYVDGLSDVDTLVLVNKSELANLSPHEVLEYFRSKLEGKFRGVESIRVGDLAVTVQFSDDTILQLLPALRTPSGLRISDEAGRQWSSVIRPDSFAQRLTTVNDTFSRKVVPVIKLFKGINSGFPESLRLEGYHIESLAIEAFEGYPDSEPRTPKAMLEHFVEQASRLVRSPIIDKTGQSLHVDDYLGKPDSEARIRVAYTLENVFRRMRKADEAGYSDEWLSTLGE